MNCDQSSAERPARRGEVLRDGGTVGQWLGRWVTRGGLVLGLTMLASLPLGAEPVPVPSVTGPVPTSAPPGDASHDYPFFATNLDLSKYGYVEEEFFIEGTATRYDLGAPDFAGKTALPTASVLDGGHPYKTRMVVRRPTDARRFNGTVVLEWYNVTNLYDVEIDWLQSHEFLMRNGYAWVGVSAQNAGIATPGTGLKDWSPRRYGTLDVTAGGTVSGDALSYDIFSQAAQAVRSSGRGQGVQVMGDLRVRSIIGSGDSQSAGYLGVYVNAVHPLAHAIDALLLHSGGQVTREDVDIPVFKLLTETDVTSLNLGANLQPDTDRIRTWTVAGASHSDVQLLAYRGSLQTRDLGTVPAVGDAAGCTLPPRSIIPAYKVQDTIYRDLRRWLRGGVEPPQAPPLDVVTLGPPVQLARDEQGNALGGIRLAEHAVPTALNTGVNSGQGFCNLWGASVPFDAATLQGLYASHDDYVERVAKVTLDNLGAGYLLLLDAKDTLQAAEAASVP
ncbi:alpha/beta hydrolase domain-containing protein [Paracraurococcus lichenis]|uniref:Alpha/beta hydrolase domain-containing protein n=1 Tax=Paracraurococcus lichenis TaxID=3064888 RepID=A0ABT9E737_9PROT|nr:alpha/beta hydrolase domain-containing protein [Paracraurococcus sp. LOR1-02]MDO9711912.1 alpha/beta hydrolase domain-containing protein [Paracraurococcus sp. LOR1-02]